MTLPSPVPSTLDQDGHAGEAPFIPAAIQPHGILLVLDRDSGTVLQAGESVRQHLGREPAALLGQGLPSLLREGHSLHERAHRALAAGQAPCHMGEVLFQDRAQPFELTVHGRGPSMVAEFEPVTEAAAAPEPGLDAFASQLMQCASVPAMCELAVAELQRLTGFGRTLCAVFDADGHNHIAAERRTGGYKPLLGLQFPASDTPGWIRRLYLANPLRLIADASSPPSPLFPPLDPRTHAPTDLSQAWLRSVEPLHAHLLQFQGVRASLAISLVVDGRLWGLLVGHDALPRMPGAAVRRHCQLLGQLLSMRIGAHQATASAQGRRVQDDMRTRLMRSVAQEDHIAAGLSKVPEALVAFARAGGAAIVADGECVIMGSAPARPTIFALCAHLARLPARTLFHTHSLGRLAPQFDTDRGVASGVLAIAISQVHAHYVLWFRPEWVHAVNWAGHPAPPPGERRAMGDARPDPRPWREEVRGQSLPWEAWELDGAAELMAMLLATALRQAETRIGQADELRRTNKELEAFSYSVSHDLRAPLRHIAGYAELLNEYEGSNLSERGLRYLENIGESARFAGDLVDALLTFSQMGRSALRPSQVELAHSIEQIQRELAPDLQDRHVIWTLHELPPVFADASYLHLALRNLVSNAIKYTRTRATASIEIGAEPRDGGHVIYIRDNGVGFDMKYVGKLFGVFQRLHRMDEFEGTGIGLANVRRIVERHGGHVWAEGKPGRGATFYVFLPGAEGGLPIPPKNNKTLPH